MLKGTGTRASKSRLTTFQRQLRVISSATFRRVIERKMRKIALASIPEKSKKEEAEDGVLLTRLLGLGFHSNSLRRAGGVRLDLGWNVTGGGGGGADGGKKDGRLGQK